MRFWAALVALALGGCTTLLPASQDVRFDPIRYFSAPTAGTGTLHPLVGRAVPVRVSSVSEGDLQQLTITQTIEEGDKPARKRIWRIRRVSNDDYAATLTDAVGPVEIRISAGRAFLGYQSKGGLLIRQELALQPNSLVLCNRLVARKFGVAVARLHETIRRLPLAANAPDPCPW